MLTTDLAAVAENVRHFAALAAPAALMAVVKSDGFGHGAAAVATTAIDNGAVALGVTSLSEAVALREQGLHAPILSWLNPVDVDVATALEHRIDLTAPSTQHLSAIADRCAALGQRAHIHLQLDTGLARDGASEQEWASLTTTARAAERAGLITVVGVMGHLPAADQPNHPTTTAGLHALLRAVALAHRAGLRPQTRHLAATAAVLHDPTTHLDMVRVGAGLVGITPSPPTEARGLTPSAPAAVGGLAPSASAVVGGLTPSASAVVGGLAPSGSAVVGGLAPSASAVVGGLTPSGSTAVGGLTPSAQTDVGGLAPSGSTAVGGLAPSAPAASAFGATTPSTPAPAAIRGVAPSAPAATAAGGLAPSAPKAVGGRAPSAPAASAIGGITPSVPAPSAARGVAPSTPASAANRGVAPSAPAPSAVRGVAPAAAAPSAIRGVAPPTPSTARGVTPSTPAPTTIRGALRLTAPVVQVRRVPAGTAVGYGHTHITDRPTGLALLPIGYADGLPRAASGRAEVLLAGRRCPVIGLISMDQTIIDIGDTPIGPGDIATLFGPGHDNEPTLTDWAHWSNTIPHEIVTGIGPRVRRNLQ